MYTKLGSTGLDVSKLCFGTWRFGKESDGTVEVDRETSHELLNVFADRGGNFIDTANTYGDGDSERWIGEWLSGRDREQFVIASKVYNSQVSRFGDNLGRKNIRAEIEGTLERLSTDYIDIYYIHRFDDETPIQETLRTLDKLVQEGKINYLAASATHEGSSKDAWKLMKALWKSDLENLERFEVTQPRFNATDRPHRFLEVCADQKLAVCPYSPLEMGFLTSKYDQGVAADGSRADLEDWDLQFSERQWRILHTVQEVAGEINASPAQVALRWLMDQRSFTCIPIFGARTTAQLEENLGAFDISLSDKQYHRITDAYDLE